MKKLTIEAPSMYGDHHVTEARRILLALAGIKEVYASSSFHTVEVEFDQKAIAQDAIMAALKPTGYLEPLPVPTEPDHVVAGQGNRDFIRHTTSIPQAGQAITFTQQMNAAGCAIAARPNMELLTKDEEA